MLKTFCVENFKNFNYLLKFDLSGGMNYEFNEEVINKKEKCITKAIVYGTNGSGKSNLGLALFDITTHLTDKEKLKSKYNHYSNLESTQNYVDFKYEFEFHSLPVTYSYRKSNVDELCSEELIINNIKVITYDFLTEEGSVNLKGAESLNLKASHSPISRVKYVSSNAILDQNDPVNQAFTEFIEYVNHMLLFYSLESNGYQGFQMGSNKISEGIISKGKLSEFQKFLKSAAGIKYNLFEKQIDGNHQIYCKFKNGEADLFSIASSGTKSLALFYYWYIRMQESSFVYIDEFDAFYHFELSEYLVKLLRKLKKQQVILTTQNTDLLSNELLRPDCYFIIETDKISPLPSTTDKDLRKAHHLQKMYKAGAFH